MQRSLKHTLICSFLLCLFALGITPTVILHSVFAQHKDGTYPTLKEKGSKITPATFNCNIKHCVACSPFIPTMATPAALGLVHVPLLYQLYTDNFFCTHHFFCELRGPPFC